ncbi:sulfite reductase (NADPH) flavoprotein alpha-component [Rhodococcus triatomae]|uniref:assimilatory sulfite reductase (NADPH) n=1 Tax=Rhodococcus triatomae TaxID=300028 RepID=A0A1G8KBV6_9NOCA|nr:FAD-binding protein [Rhodococcus triatomae]SDI40873.1 sulfite reductase (NADPH) flavoprotein alpha-component [Rhodococcus triatomae]
MNTPAATRTPDRVVSPETPEAATRPARAGQRGTAGARTRSPWNRKNPYRATLVGNRVLSGPQSTKEVRHYEFDLADSGISYEPGDGLGVQPVNDPALVDEIVTRLGVHPDHAVAGHERPLSDLLSHSLELRTPGRDLLEFAAHRTGDSDLAVLAGDRTARDRWARGRDVLDVMDVLDLVPGAVSPDEFVGVLEPLRHRTYSISSAPAVHGSYVHLTVTSVRHRTGTRDRHGTCSTYLADRIGPTGAGGVFPVKNRSFRLPEDDTPVIMIGPGTGVAPFRAFLHERAARGARGANWLFFGDRHRGSDFLYGDELCAFRDRGLLTRLDVAFSRDRAEKDYVWHRMLEHGAQVFAWLEEGAHVYVCGDALAMAVDVDRALHELVATHGARDTEQAREYVAALRAAKRYVRDVY